MYGGGEVVISLTVAGDETAYTRQDAVEIEVVKLFHGEAGGGGELQDDDPAAGAEDAVHLGETEMEVLEVAYAESDSNRGKSVGGKIKVFAIAMAKFEARVEMTGGSFLAGHGEHVIGYVDANNAGGAVAKGFDGEVARAAGNIEEKGRGSAVEEAKGAPPPTFIDTEGEKVVEEVVTGGDAVEHLLYFFFLGHGVYWFKVCHRRSFSSVMP